ncbi:MAG: DUF4157 domain-containing protein [Massilia sp.]
MANPLAAGPVPLHPGLLQRKCECGSVLAAGARCSACGKAGGRLQRKLALGAADSPLEAEADRVAAQVLAAPAPGRGSPAPAPVQVQRAGADPARGVDSVPASVGQALGEAGQALEPALEQDMGQRFGHDFSRVRVHTGGAAQRSARDINAHAYTVGHDIVFGAGRYAPATGQGRQLLAHELTHVLQQAGGGAPVARALVQAKASGALPTIRQLLRKHGFLGGDVSEADVHQVLQLFKAMTGQDLRDTVRALEEQDQEYVDRLLIHAGAADKKAEFETLRAIKNARVWKVETKNDGTAVTTEVVGSCSPEQFQAISRSTTTGMAWLASAVARIDAWLAAPNDAANASVAEALKLYFHSLAPKDARHVRARLASIRSDLERAPQFSIECHGVWDPECAHAGAYVGGTKRDMIVFCHSHFSDSAEGQAEALVHEMAHAQVGDITDRAYRSDRMLAFLSTEEALTNAESYGLLAQQLGSGKPQKPGAPRDTQEDCPAAWWTLLQKAVAVAERWNRNLQVSLPDVNPAGLKPPSKMGGYLGGATQGHIDSAAKAVDRVAAALASPISFECEPEGGGRCDNAATYWYAAGDLHVCPSWAGQPDEGVRTQSLLAGLYGYVGEVGDDQRRNNYARLARDNNGRWGAPKLGSASWTPETIAVDVKQLVPKAAKYIYTESGTQHQRVSADMPVARLAAPVGNQPNFGVGLSFFVDLGDRGRPLPFKVPELRAAFRYTAPGDGFSAQAQDLRPRYLGEGYSLRTDLREFRYRLPTSGTMTMRFELKDPDAKLTRVYDDTLQLAVAP